MRPPTAWALCHHFENPLFEAALEHVVPNPDCFVGSMNREAAVLGWFLVDKIKRSCRRSSGNVLGGVEKPHMSDHVKLYRGEASLLTPEMALYMLRVYTNGGA